MEGLEYARTPDGKHVAFRVYSAGAGVPLFYLPAMLYSIESIPEDPPYARLISGLAELGPLVLVERQGVGVSDPLDPTPSVWEQWVVDVIAVADHLGFEQVTLFGGLVGAQIALEAAVRQPDRVASVIALHPVLQLPDEALDEQRESLAKVVERDDDASDSLIALTIPSRASEQGFLDWSVRAGRLAASPSAAAQFWDTVLRPSDLRRRIEEIRAPVLLICRRGYAESTVGTQFVLDLADRMPNGTAVVLEGADMVANAGDVDGLVFEIAEFLHGDAHSTKTSRPLTSLLFTDLVGSTVAARSAGDADWRKLLDHHDRLIDRTLRRHGGTMIKATGDGALMTFDAPSRALHCAVALRDELAALGLGVRMGVHLGEIEGRGADVAGVAVHLASRVMSAADAGDILTTAAVSLATLGGGFTFESCGRHELKGFDDDFELFRLVV